MSTRLSLIELSLLVLCLTAAPCTADLGAGSWSRDFGLPMGEEFALVADLALYDGDLFAAGALGRLGLDESWRLARFDGTTWHRVPFGIKTPGIYEDATGFRLAVYAGELIVAGEFSGDGDTNMANIASWDGATWRALGEGLNGYVGALAVHGSELVVAGAFSASGATSLSGVARWDGDQWHPMGEGIVLAEAGYERPGLCFAEYDSSLVLVGDIRMAGGLPVHGIARWNGSSWQSFGAAGQDEQLAALGTVRCAHVMDGELWIGGESASSTYAQAGWCVARFDGSQWSPAGPKLDWRVHDLEDQGGFLYCAGSEYGDEPHARAAMWTGTEWIDLEIPMRGAIPGDYHYSDVRALLAHQGQVVAGGVLRHGAYAWSGQDWQPLGSGQGLDGPVRGLLTVGSDVIVAGEFMWTGSGRCSGISRWDGGTWTSMSAEDDPEWPTGWNRRALTDWRGAIVAAGTGLTGGEADSPVAQWTGSSWTSLGSGPTRLRGSVRALAVWQGELYAGGSLTEAGGVATDDIACWDNSMWRPVVSGPVGLVSTLLPFGDRLIAGSMQAQTLAAWDGSSWTSVGTLTSSRPYGLGADALCTHGGDMIVGGSFDAIDGVPAANIARWDGQSWFPIGEGADGRVTSLAEYQGMLIAGGSFTRMGDVAALGAAYWDGQTWHGFTECAGDSSRAGLGYVAGDEDEVEVSAISGAGTSLYFGGTFSTAGGMPSCFIACWQLDTGFDPAAPGAARLFAPNPSVFKAETRISFEVLQPGPTRLTIHDLIGRQVAVLDGGSCGPGVHHRSWDGRDGRRNPVASGVYFVRLQVGEALTTQRVVVTR